MKTLNKLSITLLGILAFAAFAAPMDGAAAETNNSTLPSNISNVTNSTNVFESKAIADTLAEDGRLLYEMGKLDDAKIKLNGALALEPDNAAAKYNLSLMQPAQQKIVAKLDHIRLTVCFERLNFEEVLHQVNEMAKQNDPEKIGINFSTATNAVSGQLADVNSVGINLSPALIDVRLADVLDAIVEVADKPIKYSILDEGIVFSARDPADDAKLFTHTFKVDLATLRAGLESVCSFHGIPIFTNTLAFSPGEMAREFFKSLGVNWQKPSGKSVIYNNQTGILVVAATEEDLSTIQRGLQMLKMTAPQVHIKARFVEVPPDEGNPLDFSPRATTSSTRGFQNSDPTIVTVTGVLTDANFPIAFCTLQQRAGFEMLAEPEVITTSGRQTQMRATDINQNLDFYDDINPNGGSGSGNQF